MSSNITTELSNEAQNPLLRVGDVTSRYLFFYEAEEDGWTFEIEAKDHEEAFDKAYAQWGPQVEDMYYRVI